MLTDSAIDFLDFNRFNNVLATYYFRCFLALNEPWSLIKACSQLRKADLPQKCIDTANKFINGMEGERKLQSALLTTKGGALRDIKELIEAISCADKAINIQENYHPHNLLGAIYYELAEPEKGDEHFQKAVQLGSNPAVKDSELKVILTKTNEETKSIIVEYLINKDPEKYGWVRKFAK